MSYGPLIPPTRTRAFAAPFFCISGVLAIFMTLLGAPSFWYLPCAVLWATSGLLWWFRPSIAASFSVFPVLGIAVLIIQFLPNFRQTDYSYRALLICLVVALGLIVASFEWTGTRQSPPLAISFGLVLVAFGADRLWTDKVVVCKYSMNWLANGRAPWGNVETNEKGESPIVVYRKIGDGYCYDAVFSPELREKLTQSNKSTVDVEYNVFSDFGHRRSYNVRAIDGIVFNEAGRTVRPGESYGGYIEMDGSRSVDCGR
jgi:hypothetical protein